jgi:hypothetical protein
VILNLDGQPTCLKKIKSLFEPSPAILKQRSQLCMTKKFLHFAVALLDLDKGIDFVKGPEK